VTRERKNGAVSNDRRMAIPLEPIRRKMLFETKIKNSARPKNYISKP
jgi:hypothetical protein